MLKIVENLWAAVGALPGSSQRSPRSLGSEETGCCPLTRTPPPPSPLRSVLAPMKNPGHALVRHGLSVLLYLSYRSTWRSCPCTSSLVSTDEYFNRMESGYQMEETARTSQEKHGRLRFRVILECQRALIPACLNSSWPWKRDATVSEDYALLMMMMIMMIMMMCVSPNWRQTMETGQRTTRVNSSATRL